MKKNNAEITQSKKFTKDAKRIIALASLRCPIFRFLAFKEFLFCIFFCIFLRFSF